MVDEKITIDVELSVSEAWAFAQFLKRVSHGDYLPNAENEDEAYQMRYAGGKIQDALARHGFNPR